MGAGYNELTALLPDTVDYDRKLTGNGSGTSSCSKIRVRIAAGSSAVCTQHQTICRNGILQYGMAVIIEQKAYRAFAVGDLIHPAKGPAVFVRMCDLITDIQPDGLFRNILQRKSKGQLFAKSNLRCQYFKMNHGNTIADVQIDDIAHISSLSASNTMFLTTVLIIP